jgi:hypothetical protein
MPDEPGVRLDLKTIIAVGTLVVSLASIGGVLAYRVNALEKVVADLSQQVHAMERAVQELTITLKVKGVVQ